MLTYRINLALKRAEAGELAARRNFYVSDMNRAQQAIKDGDLFRASPAFGLSSANQSRHVHSPPATPGRSKGFGNGAISGNNLKAINSPFSATTLTESLLSVCCRMERRRFRPATTKQCDSGTLNQDAQSVVLEHDDGVTGAACSPDGRWLATGTFSKFERCPLRLWDLATRQAITLTTNFWLRSTLVFSPDSQLLAVVDLSSRNSSLEHRHPSGGD